MRKYRGVRFYMMRGQTTHSAMYMCRPGCCEILGLLARVGGPTIMFWAKPLEVGISLAYQKGREVYQISVKEKRGGVVLRQVF